MKAALFAVLFLIGADLTVGHSAVSRNFLANMHHFGQSVGAWVFY